ncbi:MAG TPA: tRNA (adenosine(37)-N6)-threonylcarbamoyltransferase complex transferase subunit TsaD [Patescibacteria group bacterium]|jgi:N6-L-threonylcarbamoyladenine synthase|nr:tRNA (adenosine(37)-N6)-threonylcarbamoyltransferase complex transferase subunit TsaD [Patescibacteria group bacterium]
MTILGIESSCDETAAAVVRDGNLLLGNVVASSMELHAPYGGVVPEIAARSHIEAIIPTISTALEQAKTNWADIDGIAVTYGAGLSGSLLVGVLTARTLAIIYNKPLYAINHVEGHVYANFLTKTSLPGYDLPAEQPEFPMLALIVSGGHTQLVYFTDHFTYRVLGQTLDDAVGEAFDKVAKMLGLAYPGGPSIQVAAAKGKAKFPLPTAKLSAKYNFSFSGLKTAVLRLAQQQIGEDYGFPSSKLAERLSEAQKADISASFLTTAIDTLVGKTLLAYLEYKPKSVVIAGGVASSQPLRQQLSKRLPIAIAYTDVKLCTDNGAMIATLGWYKHAKNQTPADPFSLSPKPNLVM